MKNYLIFISLFYFCTKTYADFQNIDQQKNAVLMVAKKYSEATSCDTTFDNNETGIKDVYFEDEKGGETALIVWGGDSLCDRSRLSYSYKISQLIKSSFEDRYYLLYDNIFEDFDGIGFIYPTISSIKYVSYNKYEIIAEAFNEKDQVSSNHVHSNAKAKLYKFLISIERDEDGRNIGEIKSQKLLN